MKRAHSSAVEQSAHNRSVPGSNPGGPTTKENSGIGRFFYFERAESQSFFFGRFIACRAINRIAILPNPS